MVPRPSKTTHQRRTELIDSGKYLDERKYNDRYKLEDIRNSLKSIYNHKCAFCENKVERYDIEHYRPKKTYHWLAYSWDNLLMACPTCNGFKSFNFEIIGTIAHFSKGDLKNINSLSSAYDKIEKPKMINPEVIDPSDFIQFNKNGNIESSDIRFEYTIETCKIDRVYLNDERRKILEDFKNDIRSELVDDNSIEEQKASIASLTRKFLKDAMNPNNPFLGFRRYAITKKWLNEIIKEIKTE